MAQRLYDETLLKKIREKQYETDFMGVKTLVKPIPEPAEDGDMDPRLYENMSGMLCAMGSAPKQTEAPKTVLEAILPLRAMFNQVKSLPIAEEGVVTCRENAVSADGHNVPLLIYHRENAGKGLPVLVYYHGGGFFGASPAVVEQMLKLVVQKVDCVAFNVDYRLCPENYYPQPLDDCYFATLWARDHAEAYGGSPEKITVSGDSAGGNLAAAVTLRAREEHENLVHAQALFYPAVNISGRHTAYYHGVDKSKYVCSEKHAPILRASFSMMDGMLADPNRNMMEEIYLQGRLPIEHPYASPLLADPKGLPPTLLIFGEHDFLVFEDFAYARTLIAAGVPLRMIVYRGLGHGFADQIGVTPQAEDAMDELARFLI